MHHTFLILHLLPAHFPAQLRARFLPPTSSPAQDPVTGDIIADQKKIALRYLQVRALPATLQAVIRPAAAAATAADACSRVAAAAAGSEARAVRLPCTPNPPISPCFPQGWFVIDLLATFPVDYIVRAVEGTWLCSLKGNCSWAVAAATSDGGGVSAIRMLRVVRVFRWGGLGHHVQAVRAGLHAALRCICWSAAARHGPCRSPLTPQSHCNTRAGSCGFSSTSSSCASQRCWAASR